MGRASGESLGEFEVSETASSYDDLVVAVLSGLLYVAEVNDVHLHGFRAREVDPETVSISARGVATSEVEPLGPPIKAVTYHDLVVEPREDAWFGRVYFDV